MIVREPEVDRVPVDRCTAVADVELDARAKDAALTVYREHLVDIVMALTAAIYSGCPERFQQASHDAASGIRRAVSALDVADLEHQLQTGRLLFPEREI